GALFTAEAHAWTRSALALLSVKSLDPPQLHARIRIASPLVTRFISCSISPSALGGGGDRHQAAEHATLEQSVQHGAADRLIERSDVHQEGEHREHGK